MKFEDFETISLQTKGGPSPLKQVERADAAANRQLILATARRLFAEAGVEAVCMTTVAEAAGVGKGTIYRRFANKGELCLALMDEEMRCFQETMLDYFRRSQAEPGLVQLDHFLDQLIRFMDSHTPLLREAQLHGVLQGVEAGSGSPHDWFLMTVTMLLQLAQERGETVELDIPYLAEAILAPLNANLFAHQRLELGFDLERISQGLRKLILIGLRAS